MTVSFDRIPAFFAGWVALNGNRGAVGEIAEWLSSGGFEPEEFSAIVKRHGAQREAWFREGMLDLVFAFARRCVEKDLNLSTVSDIRLLRMLLHLDESALFERRPAEISGFLQITLDAFLSDGVIDDDEELYLVEVQAAFGLSYDQLLALARPAIERAVVALESGLVLEQNGRSPRRHRLDKLTALEPTYRLATMQSRAPGALY